MCSSSASIHSNFLHTSLLRESVHFCRYCCFYSAWMDIYFSWDISSIKMLNIVSFDSRNSSWGFTRTTSFFRWEGLVLFSFCVSFVIVFWCFSRISSNLCSSRFRSWASCSLISSTNLFNWLVLTLFYNIAKHSPRSIYAIYILNRYFPTNICFHLLQPIA